MTTIETNENIKRRPTLYPNMTKAKHWIVKIMIHKNTLTGRHHQLELLAGLVALDHRRNTRLYHTQQTDGTFGNPLVRRELASHRNVPRKRILSRPLIAPMILSRYNPINFFIVVSSKLSDYSLRGYYYTL